MCVDRILLSERRVVTQMPRRSLDYIRFVVSSGIEAVFSSMVGGNALQDRIVALIAEAAAEATSNAVDVSIMTFAFTNPHIADALAQASAQRPQLAIRLIADWTMRAADGHQQVSRLVGLGLPNLSIRYKKDQPYVWDPAEARLRWSYHASRGMLHHRTLAVAVNGEPSKLLCGSCNWSANAAESYENLLVVTNANPECGELISRVEHEFDALWSDGTASLSPNEAQAHYEAVAESLRGQAMAAPETVIRMPLRPNLFGRIRYMRPPVASDAAATDMNDEEPSPDVLIAFSARRPDEEQGHGGYAEYNCRRHICLRTPAGKSKRAALTITTLALDVIYRACAGETLLIAMYALSPRIPEYGALLAAARRGVSLRVLLDGKIGRTVAQKLSEVRDREDLPIQIKHGNRMMHQKYIVNASTATILTGTANMSTDASTRHSEHRIRVLRDVDLANRFIADFETIWDRVTTQI
jgi:phosphatidylserine/phosphatidylglycerophosphate/cardiolipin synthase-like enzyme